MKSPSFFLVAGALCLAAGGFGGCTRDFNAKPLKETAVAPTGAGDPARTGSAASCLRLLEKTADAPDRPATREARRAATARLFELYAAALLAAPDHTVSVLAGPGRPVRLRLRQGAGPGGFDPSRFTTLEPVDRYSVTGVSRFIRTPGEGTPLAGTLQPILPVAAPGRVTPRPVPGLVWSVTAVPVVGSMGGTRTLTLDLYDPHTTGRVTVPGHDSQPLAADYTTPLAITTSRLRSQHRDLLGFLRGDEYFPSAGMFPTELPTPDKTPIVLVHGLISDPSDFRDLSNALAGDPEVRRRYQVWVFYYPTSLPVVYSAMLLREDMEKFIHQLDPSGTHPALHRAVLVGHSMGGLLCRLAISDGGDVYYHHFFRQPVADLRLSAEQRDLVRRAFYYPASPDTAKVVFIATPHRGSRLASGLLGNIGRLLARLPVAVLTGIEPIIFNNRDALATGASLKPGSSLNSLSPHAPVIAAVNAMTMRPGVRLYSILGDRGRPGPRDESSDGVVPYTSSHLPQAESERMVPAGHTGTLKRPETAAELIRILHQTPPGGAMH